LRTGIAVASVALIGAAVATVSLRARTNSGELAFPENFAAGVLYTTVDRADLKQHRELFAPPAAIAAAKNGAPMPHGTVLTLVQYAAQLDAAGDPTRDQNGRFIKGPLVGYSVMEKRPGGGAAQAAELRNGDWDFQTFTVDRQVNTKADVKACYQCHKVRRSHDFLFSDDKLNSAK
jgi:hypothetical protein